MSRWVGFPAVSAAATIATVLVASMRAAAIATAPPRNCVEWRAAPGHREAIRRARPLVPKLWRGLRAPGLAFAVAVRGSAVWAGGCGYANRERRVRVSRATRFRIGSVSKTVTSMALAQLVADGRLELDADVRRYVPAFPRKQAPVTVRQLAAHTAGVRHYQTRSEVVNTRRYASVGASLSRFARDPLLFAPGTRFAYSSYGWNLLGAAVEGASGEAYGAFLGRAVLAPLRAKRTSLDARRGRAALYELTSRGTAVRAPHADLSDRWPSGGLVSTPDDLARLASAFAAGKLVDERVAAAFFEPQRTRTGARTAYGLGWEVGDSPLGRLAGHTGNVVGGTAAVLVHLETGVALAIATNVGSVTASSPPPPRAGTPDPPLLLQPFVESVRSAAG